MYIVILPRYFSNRILIVDTIFIKLLADITNHNKRCYTNGIPVIFISHSSSDSINKLIEKKINRIMLEALNKIAFLPFALVIDNWRWGVFKRIYSIG